MTLFANTHDLIRQTATNVLCAHAERACNDTSPPWPGHCEPPLSIRPTRVNASRHLTRTHPDTPLPFLGGASFGTGNRGMKKMIGAPWPPCVCVCVSATPEQRNRNDTYRHRRIVYLPQLAQNILEKILCCPILATVTKRSSGAVCCRSGATKCGQMYNEPTYSCNNQKYVSARLRGRTDACWYVL